MFEIRSILVFLSLVTFIECAMEPYIVGGKKAKIEKFPHSVFMQIKCFEEEDHDSPITWICGGSIINEKIVLTAAHCFYGCSSKSTMVSVGHSNLNKGVISSIRKYFIHEQYISATTTNDIALMRLKTNLKFGKRVKRIVLMKKPPYYEKAQVAGWGVTDENTGTTGLLLKYIDQWVWWDSSCRQMHQVQNGTLCASSGNSVSYASGGDSGSALVVRGYIQIGIVSYKIINNLVVYTDTGFFYDWIRKNTKKLYCGI